MAHRMVSPCMLHARRSKILNPNSLIVPHTGLYLQTPPHLRIYRITQALYIDRAVGDD
jgi:hypothetical protein